MKPLKFFFTAHKWTGIILGLIFVNLAVTGFLLLKKKDYAWIQPPSQQAAAGKLKDCISLRALFDVVLAQNHPDFKTDDDFDRVDFRPGQRLHKVRSKHSYTEIQVCAVTGEVLSTETRVSDWVEQLHDGSLFADWTHDWLMPVVAFALLFLVGSGIYIWLAPALSKRRRRKKKRSIPPGQAIGG